MLNYLDNKRIITILSAVVFLFALYTQKTIIPYIIVAFFGCLYIPYKFKKREKILAIVGATFISSLIALIMNDLASSIMVITSGTFLFYGILQTIFNCKLEYKERSKKIFLLAFIPIVSTFLIFLYCFNFPGTLCIDSGESLQQIISGDYWNHHPVWYTFTIQALINFASLFSNSFVFQIAFYNTIQAIILALSISYAITAIRNTRFILPMILAYIVLPYHMNYASAMTKDTFWVSGLTVFTTIMYLTLKGENNNFKRQILFITSIFIVALFRTNGTVVIASAIIGTIIFLRKKNIILPLCICLGISYFLKYPMINILGILQPDIGEKTVLFQQTLGRTIAKGREIEGSEEINKLIDINNVSNIYQEDYADAIKHTMRFSGRLPILEENKKEYFNIWLKNGIKYPIDYLEAIIAHTRFWYTPQPNNWIVYNFNQPGISRYLLLILPKFASELSIIERNFPYLNFFIKLEPFTSVGLHTWGLLLMLITMCIQRNKKILLLIPYLTLLLTLITSAPTMEFRYMYGWFTILPVLIPMIFTKEVRNGKAINYYSCIQRSESFA